MNISPLDFAYVREIVVASNGIALSADKAYLAELRLVPIVRETPGCESLSELIVAARAANGAPLRKRITDAMATGETSFFRDFHPFERVRTEFIPSLLDRDAGPITIWCAACSTGQEPYSLAMMIDGMRPLLRGRTVRILATDVSRAALDRAESGVYAQHEVNRGLPATHLIRYFNPVAGGRYQIKNAIRSAVEFREHNLFDSWESLPRVDLLVLRNALIYFGVDDKIAVLRKAAAQLKPDGVMLLGGPETTVGLTDVFITDAKPRAMFFRPDMDPRRRRAVAIFRRVWGAMLPNFRLTDLLPGGAPTAAGQRADASAVDITGDWNGVITLRCPPRLARRLTATLLALGEAEAISQPEIADALGELVNVFGGNAKTTFPGRTTMSTPRPVAPDDPAPTESDTVFQFTCEGDPLTVALIQRPHERNPS